MLCSSIARTYINKKMAGMATFLSFQDCVSGLNSVIFVCVILRARSHLDRPSAPDASPHPAHQQPSACLSSQQRMKTLLSVILQPSVLHTAFESPAHATLALLDLLLPPLLAARADNRTRTGSCFAAASFQSPPPPRSAAAMVGNSLPAEIGLWG